MKITEKMVFDFITSVNSTIDTWENGFEYSIGVTESGELTVPYKADECFSAFRTYTQYGLSDEDVKNAENAEMIYIKERKDDEDFMGIVKELAIAANKWLEENLYKGE